MSEGLGDLPWHRDCGMGGHALMCPTLIASVFLTPSTPETGELRMLPGSWQRGCGPMDARDPRAPRGVSFAAAPGDVSLHYGDTMHAAPPPTPRRPRHLSHQRRHGVRPPGRARASRPPLQRGAAPARGRPDRAPVEAGGEELEPAPVRCPAVLFSALLACPASAELVAEQITPENAARLQVGGPDADGGVGDFALQNGTLCAVIADAEHEAPISPQGGALVDLVRCGSANDQWSALVPLVNLSRGSVVPGDRAPRRARRATPRASSPRAGGRASASAPRTRSTSRARTSSASPPSSSAARAATACSRSARSSSTPSVSSGPSRCCGATSRAVGRLRASVGRSELTAHDAARHRGRRRARAGRRRADRAGPRVRRRAAPRGATARERGGRTGRHVLDHGRELHHDGRLRAAVLGGRRRRRARHARARAAAADGPRRGRRRSCSSARSASARAPTSPPSRTRWFADGADRVGARGRPGARASTWRRRPARRSARCARGADGAFSLRLPAGRLPAARASRRAAARSCASSRSARAARARAARGGRAGARAAAARRRRCGSCSSGEDGTPDPRFGDDLLDFRVNGEEIRAGRRSRTPSRSRASRATRARSRSRRSLPRARDARARVRRPRDEARRSPRARRVSSRSSRPPRALETPGWIAADLHVHSAESFDTVVAARAAARGLRGERRRGAGRRPSTTASSTRGRRIAQARARRPTRRHHGRRDHGLASRAATPRSRSAT